MMRGVGSNDDPEANKEWCGERVGLSKMYVHGRSDQLDRYVGYGCKGLKLIRQGLDCLC